MVEQSDPGSKPHAFSGDGESCDLCGQDKAAEAHKVGDDEEGSGERGGSPG